MKRHSRMSAGAGISRRALLFAGGAAALGAAGSRVPDKLDPTGYASQGSPGRVPGPRHPRHEGAVDHWGAEWVPASRSNMRYADRPHYYAIDRVVIHVTQANYPITLKVFQNPEHSAAAHYVVRSSDGHIVQMVRERDVAFHAGNREYNERSIGIEHEGWISQGRCFTDAMYRSSAILTAGICDRYGIPKDRDHIIGHIEVPGSDHVDPGPLWDWDRYMELVLRVRPAPPGRRGHLDIPEPRDQQDRPDGQGRP